MEFCYAFLHDSANDVECERKIECGEYVLAYFSSKCFLPQKASFCQAKILGDESDLKKICNNFNVNIVKNECVEQRQIFFGYSPSFAKNIFVEGEKVNFEVVLFENSLIVGYPAVYGAF